MKRFIILSRSFLFRLLFSTLVWLRRTRRIKYLSVADVEKVTVLKGITGQHKYIILLHAEGQEILRVQFIALGGCDKIRDWNSQEDVRTHTIVLKQ